MKLVAPVKLLVDNEQKSRLLATMVRVNAACSWLAERAFDLKLADKIQLQKLHYREVRERFGLSSQQVIRVIGKVCEVYKRDRTKRCQFKARGAIPYDQRIYSFKKGLDRVSLLTLEGRVVVPCAVGEHQRRLLEGKRGQADLVYRNGAFYLYVTVDATETALLPQKDWLGVDLGICNLAVDSDGIQHSGEQVRRLRIRTGKLRAKLQSAGTRSAKRHLKKLRRKEKAFHAHTNHVISKEVVRKAKDTGRGIALEDLEGIRDRVTVRKAQRTQLHGWSFFQLRSFITYKGALAGVPVGVVDPRNTSRTCPECGCIDKMNRRSQSCFVCIRCGFAGNADYVGARNIASRACVNVPIVTNVEVVGSHGVQLQSPVL